MPMSEDRLREVVPAFVDLGRQVDGPTPEWESRAEALRSFDEINCQHWSWWDAVTEHLSLDDCIALAKALTACEAKFGWGGGSVAAAIWLQNIVSRRDREAARVLADWQLARTRNPWVPFGRMNGGARSVVEFTVFRAEVAVARARRHEQIETEQLAAARRRVTARQAAIERRERQAAAAVARRAWLERFQEMSIAGQLRELADRADLHVNYFPRVFDSVAESDLRHAGLDVVRRLWARVKDRRERQWRRLRALAEAVLAE